MQSPEMRRSRRRQRGAVLVESLIVIGMLVVMLAAGVFLHGVYSSKLQGMARASNDAWEKAEDCQGGLLGAVVSTLIGIVDGFAEAADSDPNSSPMDGQAVFSVGNALGSADSTAPGLRGGSVQLHSETRVACNEKVQEHSDLASLFQWGFSEIAGGF